MSFPWGDEAPHIFTRRSRQQPLEFLSNSAKRFLQQYRHLADTTAGLRMSAIRSESDLTMRGLDVAE